MARIDVTQDTVLERVVERLRSAIDLSEQRCYDTLDPDSPLVVPPGGEFFLTVSPGPGEFVTGEQIAGNITEEWSVVVAIFCRIQLDKTGRDSLTLGRQGRGLLAVKKRVLAALSGHDLKLLDDEVVLRQLLYAISAGQPRVMQRSQEMGPLHLYQMTLSFGVEFDWDLT